MYLFLLSDLTFVSMSLFLSVFLFHSMYLFCHLIQRWNFCVNVSIFICFYIRCIFSATESSDETFVSMSIFLSVFLFHSMYLFCHLIQRWNFCVNVSIFICFYIRCIFSVTESIDLPPSCFRCHAPRPRRLKTFFTFLSSECIPPNAD